MATEALQECHWLAKLAAAGLLDLVLHHTSLSEAQSEAHLAASPETISGPPVELTSKNTLPGLSVELIGEIASHLDSADLCSLRKTTKWLATAVDHHYRWRHPAHTTCRNVQQLPRFLCQLVRPAVYTNINHLTLTGGLSAEAYPAFSMFYLPHLSELVLVDIKIDSISLLNMCSIHLATLRTLSIHNVCLESLGPWEALFFMIMVLLKLDTLKAKDLTYESDVTGVLSMANLPSEGLVHGLEKAEGLKGCREIKQLMNSYLHDGDGKLYDTKITRLTRILREADGVLHEDE
jgi:hypothetical protein